jgi:hypothetical protein
MENPEAVLKEISSTLKKPVKKVAHVDYIGFRAKVDALKQLDPSLVTLFRLCDEILGYIDQYPRSQQTLEHIASDLKALTLKTAVNLKRIDGVQNGLSERIRRFDLLEVKYTRMITRVNDVLGELERVLKQM